MKLEELDDTRLLALNIDREAEGEPDEGKIAVGSVVLNRADYGRQHPAWGRLYGDSIHSVILAPSQFSWTLPGKNRRIADRIADDFDKAVSENRALARCYEIALQLISVSIKRNVSGRYYHRFDCHPRWSKTMTIERQIGAHIFYAESASVTMQNKDYILAMRGIAERLRSLCLITPKDHMFYGLMDDTLDTLDGDIQAMVELDKIAKVKK